MIDCSFYFFSAPLDLLRQAQHTATLNVQRHNSQNQEPPQTAYYQINTSYQLIIKSFNLKLS